MTSFNEGCLYIPPSKNKIISAWHIDTASSGLVHLNLGRLAKQFGGCPVGKMVVQMNGQKVEILYNLWYQNEVDKDYTAATVFDEKGGPLIYGEVFVCGLYEQDLDPYQRTAIVYAHHLESLGGRSKKFILKDAIDKARMRL